MQTEDELDDRIPDGRIRARVVGLKAENANLRAELERLRARDAQADLYSKRASERTEQLIRDNARPALPTTGLFTAPLGHCTRCGAALNNVAPGFSVVRGGARICATCLLPGEEVLRGKGL